MTRRIITSYINPPIPYRDIDWHAYFDGEEDGLYHGYGATKEEAIADLKALYEADGDNDDT